MCVTAEAMALNNPMNRQHPVVPRCKQRDTVLPVNADQHATVERATEAATPCADMLTTSTPTHPEGYAFSRRGA
jgi:hypothetical protein